MSSGGSLVSHPRLVCPWACILVGCGNLVQGGKDQSFQSSAAVPVFSSCGGECEVPDIPARYEICSIYLEPFLSAFLFSIYASLN